jgi:hypothetical protein
MLEWCIPVVITRESTDTQGSLLVKSNTKMDYIRFNICDEDVMQKVIAISCIALSLFGVVTVRNKDAEKLHIHVGESYLFLEK